jgi:hypothetical protein
MAVKQILSMRKKSIQKTLNEAFITGDSDSVSAFCLF